ncbi:glycoside hydrolase family 3 protein [Paraglaciecola polaris]|uniref:beta-N-acetylhexosaminidase n=1 Tax=Paraglaciecola polaris LMG 21857 TaxID=1129793 RepID=K6YJX8_9ALTE|nr:glycoside hydrolase family 3 protein [Paraglaciecola polaris]GAC33019.1 beta-N-acetylhexosaminidase [Paraglaciecola polaris LMG 21857]|tara:strand:- start:28468 stop:30357 length:1890 start_codon:yes stop_codon:yes gene_type:complete
MGYGPSRFYIISVLIVSCISCVNQPAVDPKIEALVAQKLMPDIRYFCPNISQGPATKKCTTPVTVLPKALKSMIADTGVGGIILFANNLHDTEQMIRLNRDLQASAALGGHQPLFISIDQEGGRVVRIPQNISTAFSGNMAIGATYAQHGTYFAKISGEVIAKELAVLGFNLNFAPTVDVNVNPENPVINVRSFGEDPQIVAELGLAQMQAMQSQGIISALKHFPGHGDTNTDSHSGLPLVEHDISTIEAVDLAPFQYAIDHAAPGMIMTAHIQYPALDNNVFDATDGSETILPATMSRPILTDLLRKKMGYQGVIITDALDMAAIAHFYQPTEAVIQTFKAGADIALMPIPIRTPSDIPKLKKLIHDVAYAIQSGHLSLAEVEQSVTRINRLKQDYIQADPANINIPNAVSHAQTVLASPAHLQAEQALADSSIIAIKNQQAWPINKRIQRIHMVMPDNSKCMALTTAFELAINQAVDKTTKHITCSSLTSDSTQNILNLQREAQMVIFSDITPQQSLVEMGGMDDLVDWRLRPKKDALDAKLMHLIKATKPHQTSLLLSMRTPYNVPKYANYVDGIIASFAYNTQQTESVDSHGQTHIGYQGPIYHALANILLGTKQAQGTLPVSIE